MLPKNYALKSSSHPYFAKTVVRVQSDSVSQRFTQKKRKV